MHRLSDVRADRRAARTSGSCGMAQKRGLRGQMDGQGGRTNKPKSHRAQFWLVEINFGLIKMSYIIIKQISMASKTIVL